MAVHPALNASHACMHAPLCPCSNPLAAYAPASGRGRGGRGGHGHGLPAHRGIPLTPRPPSGLMPPSSMPPPMPPPGAPTWGVQQPYQQHMSWQQRQQQQQQQHCSVAHQQRVPWGAPQHGPPPGKFARVGGGGRATGGRGGIGFGRGTDGASNDGGGGSGGAGRGGMGLRSSGKDGESGGARFYKPSMLADPWQTLLRKHGLEQLPPPPHISNQAQPQTQGCQVAEAARLDDAAATSSQAHDAPPPSSRLSGLNLPPPKNTPSDSQAASAAGGMSLAKMLQETMQEVERFTDEGATDRPWH
eukprot:363221-Chlamydomonas_euryale.AAC.6